MLPIIILIGIFIVMLPAIISAFGFIDNEQELEYLKEIKELEVALAIAETRYESAYDQLNQQNKE